MRLFSTLIGMLAVIAFVPTSARAGDCDHAGGSHRARSSHRTSPVTCNNSGTCYVRDGRHRSTRYVIPRHNRGARYDRCTPRGQGGSWARLRRYLPTGRAELRRMYVRAYFLRRYPFAQIEGDEDSNAVATLLDIGDEEAGSARPLDAAGHLDRGVARFHVADYAGARDDFGTALTLRPKETRAQWGLAMVALCTSDIPGAAERLDALARAGELRRGDRLSAGDTFADASKWEAIVGGLRSSAQYRISDGHTHLVAAWTLAVSGKASEARRYVRLAKRWGAPAAAVKALEQILAPEPLPASPPAETPLETPSRAPHTDPGAEIAKR